MQGMTQHNTTRRAGARFVASYIFRKALVSPKVCRPCRACNRVLPRAPGPPVRAEVARTDAPPRPAAGGEPGENARLVAPRARRPELRCGRFACVHCAASEAYLRNFVSCANPERPALICFVPHSIQNRPNRAHGKRPQSLSRPRCSMPRLRKKGDHRSGEANGQRQAKRNGMAGDVEDSAARSDAGLPSPRRAEQL